tara:strand:- start:519 stop:974 length:456 start_codon:yes stop_codon:yes gene_type:complete
MYKKITIFLSLLFFLFSCGYSPIYNSSIDNEFYLEITNLDGDNYVNKLIKTNLNKYSKKDSDKKFQIKIYTILEKKDLSKDITGKISNYQITIVSTFHISSSNSNKKIVIKENFNLKNSENTFEKQQYEKSIIKNYAESSARKLILELLRL